MHYGNFTLYLKSVVYKQQNVLLAEDIFAMGYVGGNDCHFFKTYEDFHSYMQDYAPDRSLFACITPYSSTEHPNPMDITGSLPNDRAVPSAHEVGYQYASAGFYRNFWKWDNQGFADGGAPHYTASLNRMNSICYQGHQSMYNAQTKTADLVIKGTGHWGDKIYPGCGKVRAGFAKMLENVNYNNVYGGGGTAGFVSLGY